MLLVNVSPSLSDQARIPDNTTSLQRCPEIPDVLDSTRISVRPAFGFLQPLMRNALQVWGGF
jgi:hypothetical protein